MRPAPPSALLGCGDGSGAGSAFPEPGSASRSPGLMSPGAGAASARRGSVPAAAAPSRCTSPQTPPAPAPEGFHTSVDVALGDVVQGWAWQCRGSGWNRSLRAFPT